MPTVTQTRIREARKVGQQKSRAGEREVIVGRCKNKRWRKIWEADDVRWLLRFFRPGCGLCDPFTYDFTSQQLEMIGAFGYAIRKGGDQAIAASRGEGKTTIVERLIVKYSLQGILPFSVLFQASGTLATNSLESIKTAITDNDYLQEYYPEVCDPVRALEHVPHRAPYQIVTGRRHDNNEPYKMVLNSFTWSGQEVVFPKCPGSPSAGSIVATRGLDSAVRGLKQGGRRPSLAVIDDPDTVETARSELQAKKLSEKIDMDIGFLGGQQKPVARILLSTIQSRIAVSYKYTDPEENPSWKPKRFRYLVKPPERLDLWDDYIQLKQLDWLESTETAREHYRKNRKKMDAGAVVANPNRMNLVDGELSALEHYYTLVARLGPEAVDTEYNNDPPELAGPADSGITAATILRRLSGYPHRVIPPSCTTITQGIDVQKLGVYWMVRAWQPDATSYVVDYGFYETQGTVYGSDEGIELAIHRAILGRLEQQRENPCITTDGEIMDVDLTLVDSGYLTDVVYKTCAEAGIGVYPAKGHGKSSGCAITNFMDIRQRTIKDKKIVRKPGDGWFMSLLERGYWLVNCDTDRWKAFEHARWMTPEGKPGAAYLFGEITDAERSMIRKIFPKDSKSHTSYAKHIVSEVETEDVVNGKIKRAWKMRPGHAQNHYLDASYLANVAASMKGISLLGKTKVVVPVNRRSLADMAKGK